MFLLIKSVCLELIQKYFFNPDVCMSNPCIVSKFFFVHENWSWPEKNKKANELLIKCSNGVIYNTLRKSALVGACRTNLIEILTIWKKILICELFELSVAYSTYCILKKITGQNCYFHQFYQKNVQIPQFFIFFAHDQSLVSIFFKNAFSSSFMKVLPPYWCKYCLSSSKTDQISP